MKNDNREYLLKHARSKLDYIINYYEQSYKACNTRRNNRIFKIKIVSMYMAVFVVILALLKLIIYTIKNIIFPYSSPNLSVEAIDILDSFCSVILTLIIIIMLIYMLVQWYHIKKSKEYVSEGKVNDEYYYLSKLNHYRHIYGKLVELDDDELQNIIDIDCNFL